MPDEPDRPTLDPNSRTLGRFRVERVMKAPTTRPDLDAEGHMNLEHKITYQAFKLDYTLTDTVIRVRDIQHIEKAVKEVKGLMPLSKDEYSVNLDWMN
jgi:hypothetical protein